MVPPTPPVLPHSPPTVGLDNGDVSMYGSPSQLGPSRHSKRRKRANSHCQAEAESPYRSSGACRILAVIKADHIIVHPFDRRRPAKPQHAWYTDLNRETWRDFIKGPVTHCSVFGVVLEEGDIVAVLYRQATGVSMEFIVVHLKLYAPGSLPYQVSTGNPGSRCSSNRTHQLVIMEEETFSCFVTAMSFAEEASASPSWATGDAALVALRECFLNKTRFYQKKAFIGLGYNQLVYIPGITKGLPSI